MKKLQKIQFDMEEINTLDKELVNINNNFYIKSVRTVYNTGKRFAIPKPIINELNLKAGDTCFFVKLIDGFYISFKNKPEDTSNKQIKQRKLQALGQYQTLYLAIPPAIKNLYQEDIKFVKLIRIQGFKPNEWTIQFLTTDSI